MALPDAVTVGPDGSFAGEGTKGGVGDTGMRYRFAGRIVGDAAEGTMSLAWERLGFDSYPVRTWQIFCGGEVTWRATRGTGG